MWLAPTGLSLTDEVPELTITAPQYAIHCMQTILSAVDLSFTSLTSGESLDSWIFQDPEDTS